MTGERQAAARVLLRQLAFEGLTPEDLAALRDSGAVGGQVTVTADAGAVRCATTSPHPLRRCAASRGRPAPPPPSCCSP